MLFKFKVYILHLDWYLHPLLPSWLDYLNLHNKKVTLQWLPMHYKSFIGSILNIQGKTVSSLFWYIFCSPLVIYICLLISDHVMPSLAVLLQCHMVWNEQFHQRSIRKRELRKIWHWERFDQNVMKNYLGTKLCLSKWVRVKQSILWLYNQ